MTKIEFISFLESSLDFLDPKDKNSVLEFFHEKFSYCTSEDEENAMIEAFGAPDEFVEKLKNDQTSLSKKGKKKSRNLKSYLDGILRDSLGSLDKKSDDGDVIFSKPMAVEKASEVIHSLEDREVKPLYGEKVVIEKRTEPVKEIVLEPIDEANGLTTAEIRIAKAETLEKANHFSESENTNSADENDDAETSVPLEEGDSSFGSDDNTEENKGKLYPGFFNRILPEEKFSGSAKICLLILLTLAVSPLILLAFGLVLSIYSILVVFTVAVTVALFALMVAVIAIGVVELVYGFLILFKNVPAALIELGFGTILFSIVVAIAALIYEFIFGLVPKWLKWLTSVFVRYTKLIYCYLYGGKA